MAFNITNFKSTIDSFGGVARSSLFEVRVFAPPAPVDQPPAQPEVNEADNNAPPEADAPQAPPGEQQTFKVTTYRKKERKKTPQFTERELSFFCKSASIPGITFNTITFDAVGQFPKQFPTTMVNAPFSAIFMVDSDHEVLKYFHTWMQSVLNYNAEDSFKETEEKLPFEVGYKDEYSRTLEVRHYSTESRIKKYYEVMFYKAFPIAIGDLELSWENNDSYLTLAVTFAYDRISYSAEKSGVPSSRFSRGRNLLATLGAIAGFSSVVQQTFKAGTPTSIQDAINRLTRVRSSYDNISRRRGT